ISFRPGQAEQAFLENGIAPVPQCEREAEPALAVGDAEQAVFTPTVCLAAGVVVRKVVPAIAVRGIILPDRAPLAFGEVGAPTLPILHPRGILLEPLRFGVGHAVPLTAAGWS